jgi:hypothetical protein
MTIERVINGTIYEFPPNTPEAVIKRFEAQRSGAAPTPGAPPTRPAAPRPAPFSTGAGSQALQGLTFGFGDELVAGMRSAMGQGNYEDLVKSEREALREYSEKRPVLSTAAQVAGGVAPAILTGGAALIPGVTTATTKALGPKIAGMLFGKGPTVARTTGTGAVAGGATALGTTEKPIEEWGAEVTKGAIAGGATAGTLALLGKYAVMPAFQRLKQSMGYGDANKAADLAIVRALERDGLTPDQAVARIQAMSRGEATLADIGENTAALLRRSTAAPGAARRETKDVLATREAGRVPRVSDDLRTLMSGSQDFYTDVTDLIKKRAADADALYTAAWNSNPSFTPKSAPDIARLRNLPSFQEAMRGGSRRMADQGLDITDPKNTLRALHETKLELDDMIERAMTSDRTANQARILIGMKERLLKDMEKAAPEYRIAREAFAGDSEMLTAMKEGQRIYQLPEMDMRKLVDRFKNSPSEYDAFRAGISQAMLERLRVAGPSADPATTILSRDMESKLRRAFRDDAAFDMFKQRLMEERTMLGTEKAGFRKTPLDTDLEAQGAGAVGAGTSLLQGRPVAAALETVRSRFPNLVGTPERIAVPTAQKLLTPASKTDAVLDSIMQSLKQQETELLQATGAVGTGAALTGGLAAARSPKEQYPGEGQPAPAPASPLQSLGQ